MWRNGRRARLRCVWSNPWGFKSPHRHFSNTASECFNIDEGLNGNSNLCSYVWENVINFSINSIGIGFGHTKKNFCIMPILLYFLVELVACFSCVGVSYQESKGTFNVVFMIFIFTFVIQCSRFHNLHDLSFKVFP